MSKLKVEEYCSTIQPTTIHTMHSSVKLLNTAIMTDAGVIQSSGLGQARKWQD
jgi:hypothetical protein